MIDTLNDYLLKEAAAGRYVVVIIDEAQHLSPAVLEEVRMLSNLETARGKLIQILLVGQPELGDKLGRPELRQLRQRISLVAELKPLSYEDTVQYITHRLEVAGREGGGLFSRRALKVIYRASGGIPRLVNVICDKALVLGYGAGAKVIKSRIIKEVLKDWKPFQRLAGPTPRSRNRAVLRRRVPASRPLRHIAAAVALGLAGAALIVMLAWATRTARCEPLLARPAALRRFRDCRRYSPKPPSGPRPPSPPPDPPRDNRGHGRPRCARASAAAQSALRRAGARGAASESRATGGGRQADRPVPRRPRPGRAGRQGSRGRGGTG